jgi:hypothetical protein
MKLVEVCVGEDGEWMEYGGKHAATEEHLEDELSPLRVELCSRPFYVV